MLPLWRDVILAAEFMMPCLHTQVPAELVRQIGGPDFAGRYDVYALRSYVEENSNMAWCTGAGCENAVQVGVGAREGGVSVAVRDGGLGWWGGVGWA